jgi:hypothetical protein
MRTGVIFLLAASCFLAPVDTLSRTWHVTVDGAGDAPTIQAAIDSAGMGDTLLVGPGTYSWSNQGTGNDYGMIHMMRGAPRLTIASEMGAAMTILDGEEMGRIFFYQGYTGTMGGLTIDGFTFTRGLAPQSDYMVGGAFTAHLSSPILQNCVFTLNTADQGGACWFGGQGSPQFINCLFENNTALYGGGLFAINTPFTVMLSGCVFQSNGATRGGGFYGYNVPLVAEDCVFSGNYGVSDGGGMILNKCYPSSVSRCTFHSNESSSGGGISLLGQTNLIVDRTIIAASIQGGAAAVSGTARATFSCSDLFGNVGGDWTGGIAEQAGVNGNFAADPLFCGASGLDLFLRANSPCAPGNHPAGESCALVGARPVGCGGVTIEKRSWGAIKATFAE